MKYEDSTFFDRYREYLKIPEVRAKHDQIFDIFTGVYNRRYIHAFLPNVIDMGCGTGEFGRYVRDKGSFDYGNYVGVDLDVSRLDVLGAVGIADDYLKHQMGGQHEIAVSLFATEIHLSFSERHFLYKRWFDEGIKAILVSGIQYLSSPDDKTYTEATTGITIHQTTRTDPVALNEMRIIQHIPSGFFVEQYLEVWRILLP